MKMKNKVALALTLALGSMAAQAQDKGMDISISTTPRAPAATPAPASTPAPAAATGAVNQHALAPVKPATAQAFPTTAPAAKLAPVAKAPARIEPQKPVEPAQPAVQAPRAAQPVAVAALAAPVTPVPPVAPATLTARPAAPAAVTPAAQLSGDTNPFTGRQLDIEARQAQIESAKLDTDLMVERLKQANLLADLTYLPLKKKAEVTTMPGVLSAATTPSKPAASETAPATAPRKAVKKSSKKPAAKPAPTEAPIVKAPEPAKVSLTGVSINGDKASVILEVEGGGVFSAAHGDQTPYGRVRVVDGRSIVLGERHMTIRESMLARMYVSDPVPVDEKIKNNTVITAPPTPQPTGSNIPLPPLPPLPKAVMPKAPAPMPSR